MKAFTTIAALFVVVCSATAAFAQNDTMMIRPSVGTVLSQSEYLGLAIESHNGRGLKVFQTLRGEAAETAGLEKGDVIIGAEGYYIDTLNQLENAFRTSFGEITLTVIDVRTGRWATTKMKAGRNGGAFIGTAVGYDQGLGIGIEMLFGGRNKVTSIEPNSIAQKLGLTVGDVLISQAVSNGKYTIVFDDAETGLRYSSWYNTGRGN